MMALSSQLKLPATPSAFKTVWTWADLRKGAEVDEPFRLFQVPLLREMARRHLRLLRRERLYHAEELDDRTAVYLANPAAPLPKGGSPEIDARVRQYLWDGDSPMGPRAAEPKFAAGETIMIADPPTVEQRGCLASFATRRA